MATCFYCGGHHESVQCVSRAVDKISSKTSSSIEILGHQSLEEMNRLASQWQDAQYEIGLEGVMATGELSSQIAKVDYAIKELHAFCEWAHDEAMWYEEKQLEVLTGIRNILRNPRATQANELFKMAADSFQRERLGDALRLLDDARELNPGDYRVHVTRGHIFVQQNRLLEAKDSFRCAADYARNNRYKIRSLLLLGRVYECMDLPGEAIAVFEEALHIQPEHPQVCYEMGVLLSKGGQQSRAEPMVEKAIEADRNLFVRAKIEGRFNDLLDRLLEQEQARATSEMTQTRLAAREMKEWSDTDIEDVRLKDAHHLMLNMLHRAQLMIETRSYFGYLDAISIAREASEVPVELRASQVQQISSVIPLNKAMLEVLLEKAAEIGSLTHYSETLKQLDVSQANPKKNYRDIVSAKHALTKALGSTSALIEELEHMKEHDSQTERDLAAAKAWVGQKQHELNGMPELNGIPKLNGMPVDYVLGRMVYEAECRKFEAEIQYQKSNPRDQ